MVQPLAVEQVGAPEFRPQARAAEPVDRLPVEGLGFVAVADQGPRAGLEAQRPVGAAGAGRLRQPRQDGGRAPGLPATGRRLPGRLLEPVDKGDVAAELA